MTWLKIDDGFCEHSKIVNLSNQAFRLHVAGLCLCARLLTDGKVTEQHLRKIAADLPFNPARYVGELEEANLWKKFSTGWRIKDYLDFNPSSIQVKEQRLRNKLRQAKHRDSVKSNGVTNGVSHNAPSRPVYKTELPTTYNDEERTEVNELIRKTSERLGGV